VGCLTNDWSYFKQESPEATETTTLFSLFPHVKNNATYLRDATLALSYEEGFLPQIRIAPQSEVLAILEGNGF
jgi:hypothetical protein